MTDQTHFVRDREESRDETYLRESGRASLESRVRGPELDPTDASQREVEGVADG